MPVSRCTKLLVVGLMVYVVAACSSGESTSGGTTYDVKAGDESCEVETAEFSAGEVVFDVENTGSDVTEVYVYGQEGDDFTKIIGEVENIGPGTSQDFTVSLTPGEYQVACKPGMVGEGIRTNITVAGEDSGSEEEAEGLYDRELEFEVTESGTVELPDQGLAGATGEKIEFKMHNESSEEYYLRLLDPDGDEVGIGEAAAGAETEFIAELNAAGNYTLEFYRDGAESDAISSTFRVTATE